MTLRPLTLALAALTAMLTACVSIPLSLDTSKSGSDASMIAPMVEKRETLVATGYAVDAYRSLTEQVYGQQLDASTTVADMTVMSDTFRAKVEGVIYGAVLVSITPVGEDTYETTLSLDQQVVRDLRALYLSQLAARRR